jgi:hypothetical protein
VSDNGAEYIEMYPASLTEPAVNKENVGGSRNLEPHTIFFFFLIRIVGGGVHIGCPRGTAAMYWPIVIVRMEKLVE